MDCYCFYQQYEDHLEIAGESEPNCILHAILFLREEVV